MSGVSYAKSNVTVSSGGSIYAPTEGMVPVTVEMAYFPWDGDLKDGSAKKKRLDTRHVGNSE